MHCTSTSRSIPVHSPENSWQFFSLSGKEIRVANDCMRHALNCGPTCSKTVSPEITVSTHREEKAKMWRYGAKNVLAKAAGHFAKFNALPNFLAIRYVQSRSVTSSVHIVKIAVHVDGNALRMGSQLVTHEHRCRKHVHLGRGWERVSIHSRHVQSRRVRISDMLWDWFCGHFGMVIWGFGSSSSRLPISY